MFDRSERLDIRTEVPMRNSRRWMFGMLVTAIPAASSAQVPLNDLGTGTYLNQYQGGLYPGGSNTIPPAHFAAAMSRAANMQPLNTAGQPDPNGKFVLISIGMSNTSQ